MVRGSITTYRLRSDLLEAYFRTQFPGYSSFNVQLSADGRELYTFDIPRALTQEQLDYIEDHVRLKRDEDDDFL